MRAPAAVPRVSASRARRLRLRVGELLRSIPGGARALHLRRRTTAEARRAFQRVRPLRLPQHDHAAVRALSVVPSDEAFITGNGIAARCRYVMNFDVLEVNERNDNDWWFCRGEFLEYFFRSLAPKEPFVLFSHNTDRGVDERFRRQLDRDHLLAWFARNPSIEHPKLHAVPAGIANPRYAHGDQALLERVRRAHHAKTKLFEVSFQVGTNEAERRYCIQQTALEPRRTTSFEEYLSSLTSSYFCVSPNGNGIDCHRTWEALYVGTIPIVTRSVLTNQHTDLPMVVLDDWSEFSSIDFSPGLYERTWSDWDPDALRLDRYFARIEDAIRRARDRG